MNSIIIIAPARDSNSSTRAMHKRFQSFVEHFVCLMLSIPKRKTELTGRLHIEYARISLMKDKLGGNFVVAL